MPWRTRCGSPRRCRRRRRSSWASRAVVTRTSTWSPRPWGRRSGDAGSRRRQTIDDLAPGGDLRSVARTWRARAGDLLHGRRSVSRRHALARGRGGAARRRRRGAEAAGLDVIHLVAPTSTPSRVRLIARRSRGFIYVVSLTGVTGERPELPPDLAARIRALRLVTTKPVCIGFGISTPAQVAAIGRLADGAIVASAIVRLVEEHAGSPTLVEDVGAFIAELKAPLRAGLGDPPQTPPPGAGFREPAQTPPPGAGSGDAPQTSPPGAGLRGSFQTSPAIRTRS